MIARKIRLVLSMPHSHHSHSGQFCKHASGLLEDVIQEAMRKRFRVYGLTEHVPRYRKVDLYPEEVNTLLFVHMRFTEINGRINFL